MPSESNVSDPHRLARQVKGESRMGNVRRAASLYREVTVERAKALPQLQRSVADQDDLVRHVAAIQLAFNYPADMPESAARELLATLLMVSRVSDRLSSEYSEATQDGEDYWDLGQHIALAMACLPAGSAEFAVPDLVTLWQRDRQFYEAVLAAIALAFPEGGRPTAATLNETQRTVLKALVGDAPVWDCCMATVPVLEARGLPSSRHCMQSFLESPGGDTESTVPPDCRFSN